MRFLGMTGDGRPYLTRSGRQCKPRSIMARSPGRRDGKRLVGGFAAGDRRGVVWILEPGAPHLDPQTAGPDAWRHGARRDLDGDNASIIIGQWLSAGDIILAERSR